MLTLTRAPTNMPVLVSKRLIGTRVGLVVLVVPMKVDVPGPTRVWLWVVLNCAAVVDRVDVRAVCAAAIDVRPLASNRPDTSVRVFTTNTNP